MKNPKKICLEVKKLVEDYLYKKTWKTKENSNQAYSYSSVSWRVAGEVMTQYTLENVYPEEISRAHINGDLHLHNLYMGIVGYCAGWSIRDLLIMGFGGIPGHVESAPARHLSSALMQMINFFGALQNEWAGAQAFNSLDVYLAPFIRADRLTYEQVKQLMQQFIYNLNVFTRWGGQTPFTNITFDLKIPEDLARECVILAGKPQKEKYGEYQKEVEMFNRAFIEVMIEGDTKGRVFSFPIPTYNITKDFDWNSPIVDLVFEMAAKYGIPYFQNFIQSDLSPRDIRAMCCRLRLDLRQFYRRVGGFFGYADKTGCYDEATEVLTLEGWKFFKDLTSEDEILTLNPETRDIEYQKPIKFFEYDYNGEMIKINSKSLNLLVTPNHNMFIERATVTSLGSREKIKRYYKSLFCQADELNPNHDRIPKTGKWNCITTKEFILPSLTYTKYGAQGRIPYEVIVNPLKIEINSWLKFLGIYLAEGSVDNERIAKRHGYRVFITQINKVKKKKIKELLEELPFNYYEDKKGFVICNKQLWFYLKKLGGRYNKFIPKEIKQLPPKQLNILLEWMIMGDGYVKYLGQKDRKPRRFYWTTSKRLADDVQELFLKIGSNAQISIQKKKDSYIKGRRIKATSQKDCYLLSEHNSKYYYLRSPSKGNFVSKIWYKGKVYCCEIPNHVMYVRRNGKAVFCGNSVGVVTINMPRLGYTSKSEKEFFRKLGNLMDLAKESLEIKRKLVEKNMDLGLLPFSKAYLGTLRFHFATIGPCGMHEACLNFLGKGIETKEGRNFAIETLEFMRGKLMEYQKETGHIYNLEAIPAESTAYRFALLDKKKYPRIKTAGVKVPYYTNSTHLPVGYTEDVFEALEHQDPLQTLYTGGTILHSFLGERITGKEAKAFIRKVFEKFKLPYITITPTFSVCPEHGYLKGEQFKCSKCGKETEVYSRVVGYLRPVQNWNEGKREEFRERLEYKI